MRTFRACLILFISISAAAAQNFPSSDAAIGCLKETRWKVQDTETGHFCPSCGTSQTAVLLDRDEASENMPNSEMLREAALVLLSPEGKCLAVVKGQRGEGETVLPYFSAEMSVAKINATRDLIRIDSTYMHGYTEVVSGFFGYDDRKHEWSLLWSGTTAETSPAGKTTEAKLTWKDVNHDGNPDLVVTDSKGKTSTYLWSDGALKRKP